MIFSRNNRQSQENNAPLRTTEYMPTLRWLTQDKDVRAAEKVPYEVDPKEVRVAIDEVL